ncbi:MAG: lysophospholipid acyltransferase family protein [Romboutsia sp.]|uniref:lysophospholipid acyltransferase family protein n=1 Tax=Romboutsia sp. TaxID=1965302 RepID=UPI003F34E318
MTHLFNYIKFVTYQLLGFSLAMPRLLKLRKQPDKFAAKEKFEFLHNQAKKSLNFINIKLNIIGKEKIPKEPVLFVINHSSMLDSFILLASVDRPIGCLIADEPIWKNMPVVKDWANLTKCIYINRTNNREGIKSIIEASKNIISGHSMAVFPEGDLTWIKDPNALVSDFRNGALKIAYKAKCPIVPLVIKNSRDIYEGYEPIGKIFSHPVEVEFLDPIYDHIHDSSLKSTNLAMNIKNKMIDKIKEYKNK